MGRLANKRRVIAPVVMHDAGLLLDTVQAMKASFRHLDTSGAKVEKVVARQRTRLLMQMMSARTNHAASNKPEASKAKLGSRFTRSSQTAAAPQAPQAAAAPPLLRRLSARPPHSEGSASSCSSHSEDEAGYTEAFDYDSEEEAAAFRRRFGDPQTEDPLFAHKIVGDVSVGSAGVSLADRSIASGDAAAGLSAPNAAASTTASVHADHAAAYTETPRARPVSASTHRPCIRVAANRPFSAPRIRRQQEYDVTWPPVNEPCAQAPLSARSRPCSAPSGARRPSHSFSRPMSARPPGATPSDNPEASSRPMSARPCTQKPVRPQSAGAVQRPPPKPFGHLHRRPPSGSQSGPREKPPMTQHCDPQSRFMGRFKGAEEAPPFVDTTLPPERTVARRPASAPSCGRGFGGLSARQRLQV